MTDIATAAPGVFTRDQAEIHTTRKDEPGWLRETRLAAQEVFATTPMPTRQLEEWRYTDIGALLKLDQLGFAPEGAPTARESLPAGLRTLIADSAHGAAHLAQVDGSVAFRELGPALEGSGAVVVSLESAVRDHAELVQKYLGSAVTPQEGKFAALNAAFWSGGAFVYVPKGVRVEAPVRLFRWLSAEGTTSIGRVLVVAEEGAEVAIVDEVASDAFDAQTLSLGAVELFAEEGAKITYVAVQRLGSGAVHLTTDRLVAGRDARITTLYTTLGSDVTRADVQCRMQGPGAHVDMLGLYIAEGTQHFDHETLQDHAAPHASSNLLFKGALTGSSRSVFRGLIRVHPRAQRTDAYQTNRNLLLSADARADSLPNLEIQADDVRCSHAATVGQLDEEEVFYLLSRGIPKPEAIRLVVFGFFGEVLDQLPLEGVRQELVRAVEAKLARSGR